MSKLKRKYINKGELAKLMGISKSQIRFYENKGLMTPHYNTNGYSEYGLLHVEKLEFILFLRSIKMSITEIKDILSNKEEYIYQNILEKALEDNISQMKMLKMQNKEIIANLKYYRDEIVDESQIMYMGERIMHVIKKDLDYMSFKEIFDLAQKYGIDYRDYRNTLCEIFTENKVQNGFINSNVTSNYKDIDIYKLPAGDYYCYTFEFSKIGDVKKQRKIFREDCSRLGIPSNSKIYLISRFSRPYFSLKSRILTFQCLLPNKD